MNPLAASTRRTLTLASALLLLGGALVASTAEAALWKWIDANGRTVYSDVPPTGDVKAERVNAPPPAANPNALKEMTNQEAELKKRQLQRNEEAAKAEKTKTEGARRQDFCAQARGQVQALKMPNVTHYRINERGDRVILDEPARQKETERLETVMRAQCPAG